MAMVVGGVDCERHAGNLTLHLRIMRLVRIHGAGTAIASVVSWSIPQFDTTTTTFSCFRLDNLFLTWKSFLSPSIIIYTYPSTPPSSACYQSSPLLSAIARSPPPTASNCSQPHSPRPLPGAAADPPYHDIDFQYSLCDTSTLDSQL